MTLRFYANAPATTLSVGCTNVATTITLTSVTGLPIQYPYTLIIDRGTASEEAVSVTAAASNVLTVTRATDSTTAFAHSIGAAVEHGITAQDIRESNAHVNASSGVHGVTGSVVGTTDTQTLTSKTLTAPKIDTLKDANGNSSLNLLATASAVNYLEVRNTASGVLNPTIAAIGSDANLNVNILPKGVGQLLVNGVSAATQTNTLALSNKDLSSGTNTFPTSLVTLTGSQTLTNKILTSPTINDPSLTVTSLVAEPVIRCTSATRPAHANGRTIYETDTTKGYISDGTNWIRSFTREVGTGTTGHTLTTTPTADLSVTLPAGKWVITAKVRFDYSTTALRTYTADLFNGTVAVDSAGSAGTINGAQTVPLLAAVSISAPTTYTLRTKVDVVDGTQFSSVAVMVAIPA